MTDNDKARMILADAIFNPDDRVDLINAIRDNDDETISSITDDDDAITAARHLATSTDSLADDII